MLKKNKDSVKNLFGKRGKVANPHKDESKKEENEKNIFLASVLLKESAFEYEKFESAFSDEWGISLDNVKQSDTSRIYLVDGMMLIIGFMNFKIPEGEAEQWAAYNYMWKDAVKVTATHKAHVIVSVMGEGSSEEKAILYTKCVSAWCKLDCTIGVYANRIVFEPDFFYKASMMIKDGELPIFNTVWFGVGREIDGISGWTSGMNCYGKDEIEIVHSKESSMEIRDMLFAIVQYVLGENVTLKDGETIGMTAEQKLKITRSEGLNVPGMSLKIEF